MDIQEENDLVAIIKMQQTFGKNSNAVWAYLELFGISPLRAKRKKLRLLLEEMKSLFDSGSFKFQKKIYRISHDGMAEALNIVAHRNFPDHLENHNYLKKVMVGIAEREAQAAGVQAEKDLRQKEERLKVGHRDPEQAEVNKRRVQELIKNIG